jgi:Glutathione S-transferase, C-terminal domain
LEWLFLVVTDVIALSHHGFFIRQAFGNAASHHVIQWLDERALSMYVHIDRNLAEHTFLAGDAFSLADIAAYTITAALSGRLPWGVLPNLQRWFDAVKIRPAVIRGMDAFKVPTATHSRTSAIFDNASERSGETFHGTERIGKQDANHLIRASRPSCAGGNQIRNGSQSQNREGARPHRAARPARGRRRGVV